MLIVALLSICTISILRCCRQRHNAKKRRRRSIARTYRGIYPIVPKYNHPNNNSSSVYLPTLIASNLYGGGSRINNFGLSSQHRNHGSMERYDKYYETQVKKFYAIRCMD